MAAERTQTFTQSPDAPASRPCLACELTPGTPDFCAGCAAAAAHVISMTREYPVTGTLPNGAPVRPALSVATCGCGFFSKCYPSQYRLQDEIIRQHWCTVVAEPHHG